MRMMRARMKPGCACLDCGGGNFMGRADEKREARREIASQAEPAPEWCECPCHFGADCCAICTNDYADLCEM